MQDILKIDKGGLQNIIEYLLGVRRWKEPGRRG